MYVPCIFPHCLILADAIQGELCRGIIISTDIMHYMMSVSGLDTLESIRQTLLDKTSSESASLFELILFPDEKFQIAIEALVENSDYSKADEKTICDLLMSRKLETVLHFQDIGSTPVTIPLEAIQPVISRLNISRKTNPRIIEALHRFSDDPLRTQCKIRLRNSRWIQNEANIRLLLKIIEKPIPKDSNFIESLDIILEFLVNPHPESDLKQALVSEKERLIHLLDMADRQDHLVRTSPMEAIMLQGVRMVSIDRDEIIKRIHILDQVWRTAISGSTKLQDSALHVGYR
jgi:hypothetical protein